MKAILITVTTLLISQLAMASPTVIGNINSVENILMEAQNTLRCHQLDKDQDGIRETDEVVIELSNRFAGGITFLSAGSILNEFKNANGSVCAQVEEIKKRSFMNFTAFSVTVESELLIDRAALVENVKLTITNLNSGLPEDPAPVLEMTAQISKKLQQDPPTLN